ncbi:MAG: ParM/StbA family protein [Clostridia bacterium]|nr:ParM/StbA family protein [Clostridia bacterium]
MAQERITSIKHLATQQNNSTHREPSFTDGSFSIYERSKNHLYIIGIDHGYGGTKTANCNFQSGVVKSNTVPFTKTGVIKFDNTYYICGTGRQSLTKDKTEDENYFILTLAAIAKEIEFRGLDRTCDIIIAAGLPLTTFGKDKAAFEKYLMPLVPIRYEYEGNKYKINILDVKLYPQGYSAIVNEKNLLNREPSQILLDIGSWTVDCMIINNSIPDASSCRSLEMGIIRCIEEIQEEVRRTSGLSVTSAQVEQILQNKECTMQPEVKEIIKAQGYAYTKKLFKLLEESGFDTKAVPTILMGGGAHIVKHYLNHNQKMEILSDIHANAKGYELIALQVMENGKG